MAKDRPHERVPMAEDVRGDREGITDNGLGGEPPPVHDGLDGFDDDLGEGWAPATLDVRCLGHRAECYWRIGRRWRSRPAVAGEGEGTTLCGLGWEPRGSVRPAAWGTAGARGRP